MQQVMLKVAGLVKRYGDFLAVDHVSFEVYRGEIFGLLGPNGAGKTTTIRHVMDIITPDEGEVMVMGSPPGKTRERIGYLPEERGLYRDLKVLETLEYLGELKGMKRSAAHDSALRWLKMVDLDDRADEKVSTLSRGMQQKLQFIATLVHHPDLLILDEPFQGLDPVNVELIKTLIRDLQAMGKTIVLSAHQMNLVEAICERIFLINKGKGVLYGPLDEIKRRHAHQQIRLRTSTPLNGIELPGVLDIHQRDGIYLLTLADDTDPQSVLPSLLERSISIDTFEVATAPLQEIFVSIVQQEDPT
ncbi:MAG: ABC transporter ATP-binding protein [Chloroflexi bacterium]|nr:ABC transporter ATP-binding protein [Chloroflexota bacterium]